MAGLIVRFVLKFEPLIVCVFNIFNANIIELMLINHLMDIQQALELAKVPKEACVSLLGLIDLNLIASLGSGLLE